MYMNCEIPHRLGRRMWDGYVEQALAQRGLLQLLRSLRPIMPSLEKLNSVDDESPWKRKKMVNSRCSMKCSHGIGTLWRLKLQNPLSRSGFLIFPVPVRFLAFIMWEWNALELKCHFAYLILLTLSAQWESIDYKSLSWEDLEPKKPFAIALDSTIFNFRAWLSSHILILFKRRWDTVAS